MSKSVSCGGCSNVLELSQVVLITRQPDTRFGPGLPNATSTDTYTIPYLTLTLKPNGEISGTTQSNQDPRVMSLYGIVTSGITATIGSTLYTTLSSYTYIQQVYTDNACVEQAKIVNISETATFHSGDILDLTAPITELPAMIRSSLSSYIPEAVCTSIAFSGFPSVARPILTSSQPVQTALASSDVLDVSPSLSRSARLGLIIMLCVGLVLILGVAGFFMVSLRSNRRKNPSKYSSFTTTIRDRTELGKYSQLNETTVAGPSASNPSSKKKKSWRAPALMLTGLVSGLVFALGHHFFYQSITGLPVADVMIAQSWIFRLGNLFAFLVSFCFSITMGTAFVQLQWLELREDSLKVKDLDALTTIFGNIFTFAKKVWLRFPSLTGLAILYWLLPLAPIITPGTLNVVTAPHDLPVLIQVPQVSFTSTGWGDAGEFNHTHASPQAKRAVFPAAFGGAITSLVPAYPNQTYSTQFFGPEVKCQSANNSFIIEQTKKEGWYVDGDEIGSQTDFKAFIPFGADDAFADERSTDAARLFIVSHQFPGSGSGVVLTSNGTTRNVVDVTECTLHNTSYAVEFTYHNGEQTTLVNATTLNAMSYEYRDNDTRPTGYLSMMAALGALLIGRLGFTVASGSESQYEESSMVQSLHFDWTYASDMRTAIPQLFQNMTLSLFAAGPESGLVSDETVKAVATIYSSTYSYNPLDLLLVYGLAILCTLLCFVFGFYAFLANDDSYQNRFSTFIRATRRSGIPVVDGDTGADPRPRSIENAPVHVNGTREEEPFLRQTNQEHSIVSRPVSIALSSLPPATSSHRPYE